MFKVLFAVFSFIFDDDCDTTHREAATNWITMESLLVYIIITASTCMFVCFHMLAYSPPPARLPGLLDSWLEMEQ